MYDVLSEGTSFGSTATSTVERIFPQNLNCTYLRIANLSSTQWLFFSLGDPGESGKKGIAIPPNGSESLYNAKGRVYIWTNENTAEYAGFYST